MTISKLHKFTLAAIAAVACAGVMQAEEHGSFHLPVEAHWGRVVLEPGDYTIIQPGASLDQTTLRLVGQGKIVFESPLITEFRRYSDSSYLTLTKVDEQYFVTEYKSGVTGKTFTFNMPKETRRQVASRGMEQGLALAVK